MSFEPTLLRQIVEGALLAAGQPLTIDKLLSLFEAEDDPREPPERDAIKAALMDLQEECAGRGFELVEVASGWRLQVRSELATWVNRLWEEKPQKYSRALLETLALIAYRQPITRGDIEEIRGVAVSSHIIKTLVEREWVKVVGHRDVPGRPSLYATTKPFLDYFNLKSLDQLPSLNELQDIEALNRELNFVDSDNAVAEYDTDTPEDTEGEGGSSLNEDREAGSDTGVPVQESAEDHPVHDQDPDALDSEVESAYADGGLSEEELQQPAAPIPVAMDDDDGDEEEEGLAPRVSGPSLFDDTP